jgi:hypothetical protein
MMHPGRCAWFWLWTAAGALLALSLVSFIGVFTGLPAVAALGLIAHRSPRWPEPLGILTGIGVLSFLVGALALGESGINPAPWLAAGTVLVAVGMVAYGVALRSLAPYARR